MNDLWQTSMKRRVRMLLTATALAAGVIVVPASSASAERGVPAEHGSQAMEQHMRLMADANPGMAQMMGTPACTNMMAAPPFVG